MQLKTWVIAGLGAVAVGVLGPTASAATGSRPVFDSAGTTAAVADREAKQEELERVRALFAGATAGSPAQFRLKEEGDRLARYVDLAGQLEYVGTVFAEATPGSPAQFRAREEADALGEELGRVSRG